MFKPAFAWVAAGLVAVALSPTSFADQPEAASARRLDTLAGVNAIAYSGDGKTLVTATVGEVQLWDAAKGTLRRTLTFASTAPTPSRDTYALAVDRTAENVATDTYGGTFLWNTATGEKRQLTTDQDRSRFVDGGKVLVTVSPLDLRRWRVSDGRLLSSVSLPESPYQRPASIAPDGERFTALGQHLSADTRGVSLVSSATGDALLQLSPPSATTVTTSAEFSPDGKLLVTGDCSNTYTSMVAAAHVWDANNGRLVATQGGHAGRILTSRFSADGRLLVTAGWDALRVWEPRSGKLLRTLDKSRDSTTLLAVSPDGQRAIAALRGTNREGPLLACWDLETGVRVPLPGSPIKPE